MKKRILSLLLVVAMMLSYIPSIPVLAEGADITIEVPENPIPYSEGQGPVTVLEEIKMKVKVDAAEPDKVLFAGGYFEVDIDDRRGTEILNLPDGTYEDKDESGEVVQTIKVEDGEIFIVHDEDNLEPIGRVNPSNNGDDGKPLVVEFSTPLENGDFREDAGEILFGDNGQGSIKGWTIRKSNNDDTNYKYQIKLDGLASKTRMLNKGNNSTLTLNSSKEGAVYKVSGIDKNGEDYVYYTDKDYGTKGAGEERYLVKNSDNENSIEPIYVTEVGVDTNESTRGNVLKLGYKAGKVSGGSKTLPYGTVFALDAISDIFEAKRGDKIAFDWRAFTIQGDTANYDDFEVYGYIVKVDSKGSFLDAAEHIEIMYGRGFNKPWTTETFTIEENAKYSFRFVAGSYDNTGGLKLGATLHIDNIRLFKKSVDSKLVEFIAKNITYENGNVNDLVEELLGDDGSGDVSRKIKIKAGDLTHADTSEKIEEVTAEVNIVLNKPPVINTEEGKTETSFDTDTKTKVNGKIVAEDPDGEDGYELTYEIKGKEPDEDFTTENGGTVTIDENEEWEYTPDKDYVGDDTFTVVVTDEDGGKTEVEITITVKGTVTFDTNGGYPIPEDQKIISEGTVTKPTDPTKTGYTFKGWYKDEGLTQKWDFDNDTVTKNTTLYAKWTIKEYTVTFNSNGGSGVTPVNTNYNTSLGDNMPSRPSKEGYIFKGWNTKSDGSGTSFASTTKVIEDIEVYAQWEEIEKGTENEEIGVGESTGGSVAPKEGEKTYQLKEGSGPNKGTAEVDEKTGEWTYTPDEGKTGEDEFIIKVVKDGKIVDEIPVKVVIKDPSFQGEETNKGEEKTGTIKLDEPEESELTYEIDEGTTEDGKSKKETEKGTATVDEKTGEWTYTPKDSFDGEDEFTIVVKEDGKDDPISTIPVKVVETKKGKEVTITPPEGVENPKDYKLKEDSGPTNGTIDVDEDGKWRYKPEDGFTGEDEFVLEGEGDNEVVVKVIVTEPKERPTVTSEVYAPTTSTGITFEVGKVPIKGTATVEKETGKWTYTPNEGETGEDEFTIVVKEDGVEKATIPVKVVETEKGKEVTITLPEGVEKSEEYKLKADSGPTNGTVEVDEDGKWKYKPDGGYTGEDEFVLVDEEGNEVVVVVIVTEPKELPNLGGQVTPPEENEGDKIYKLKEEEGSGPNKGTVVVDEETGEWTYTPNEGETGEDEFTIEITVDGELIEEITINILIKDPDVPVVEEGGASGTIESDEPEEGELSYEIGQGPKEGGTATVDEKTGEWTYIPEDDFEGEDEFTIKVIRDGEVIEEITINVNVKQHNVKIEMDASPKSIVANGEDTSVLTAIVKHENGDPVGDGIWVKFTTENGTFENGEKEIKAKTDENGMARATLTSENLIGTSEATKSHEIPVTATVSDPAKELYGREQIVMTFEPSYIKGIVKDNEGKPIVGANIRVERELENGEKFVVEVTTDEDGKYKIAAPEEGEYIVEITREVGGKDVTFTQTAKIETGKVTGVGEEVDATKTFTGVIKTIDEDGTEKIVDKDTAENMTIRLVSKNNDPIDPSEKKEAIVSEDGVFTVEDLEKGTTYELAITTKVKDKEGNVIKDKEGNDVEVVMGKMTVTLDDDGEIKLHEELIDPYGTIIDSGNGSVLGDVDVRLYFSDTPRNKAKGYNPGTLVPLPEMAGFAPNDNKNPQTSTNSTVYSDITGDHGNYAWMVFPEADYYIVARKTGYKTYTSVTISVEWDIVKHDFSMEKRPSSGGATIIPPKEEPKDEPTPEIVTDITTNQRNYLEGTEPEIEVNFLNKGDIVTNVELVVTIPEGAKVIDPDGGTVKGNTIVWLIAEMNPEELGTKKPTIKLPQISTGEETVVIEVQLMMGKVPLGEPSFIEVAVFSNRYGNGKHSRYILGYPDGEFKPDKQITRAEIATIFARILNLDDYVKNETMYKDVEQDAWYARAVEAASRKGLFEGYEDGAFRPDDPITRAELSAVIARYLNLVESQEIKENFKDIKGHWAEEYIKELYRNNVVSGYSDGTFRPQEKLKRSETVTMINRMLDRGPLMGVEPTFPDVNLNHWANGEVEESTNSHEYYRNEDGSETLIRVYVEELSF